MDRLIYEIDGNNFDDFAGFIQEFDREFVSHVGGKWSGNLDALNDYLSWSDRQYVIRWKNSAKSHVDLSHKAMEEWLAGNLLRCHASNRDVVQAQLDDAESRLGPTLFELLVEIIQENSDIVDLVLD